MTHCFQKIRYKFIKGINHLKCSFYQLSAYKWILLLVCVKRELGGSWQQAQPSQETGSGGKQTAEEHLTFNNYHIIDYLCGP